MEYKVAPSLLAADFTNWENRFMRLKEAGGTLSASGCNGWSLCSKYFFWNAGS